MTTGNQKVPGREIEDLLPWYAAGTLGRRDAERVAAAVASDRELARRLELVREELAETIHLNETLGAPSVRAGQKLFAAMDAEGVSPRGRRLSFDFAGRLSGFLSTLSPRTLAWSACAGALVLVLQASVITSILLQGHAKTGTYETASAERPAPSGQGSEVLIRFAPEASAADITRFLKAHDASVVEGPAGDLYRVRVSASRLPQADLDRIVKSMQSEKGVVVLVLPGGG